MRMGGLEMGRRAEELLSHRSPVLAKPPVRRLAKDLGVDLEAVDATGHDGVITRADVERAALIGGATVSAARPGARGAAIPRPIAAGERETRTPIKGVTKLMAEAMVTSAFTAPHVTEWVEVDVTRTLELVERLKARPELDGVRVSPLLLVALGLVRAARRHPGINAVWDAAAQEIVTKHYVNLGIAAATPRGLVVPNVKDADALDLVGLARALHDLVETAKAGKTSPADMSGGTITITNVGVFGVDGGTPIINPGESAILCMGRAVAEAVGRRRRGARAPGDAADALVRPPPRRRRARLAGARRRRPLPRGPGGRPPARLTADATKGPGARPSERRDPSS